MSDKVFNTEAINKIMDKIKKDKSGRLAACMQEIMDTSERAGKLGYSLEELSIMVTTGWYLSQSPELRRFFDQLLSMPPPSAEDDDVWN